MTDIRNTTFDYRPEIASYIIRLQKAGLALCSLNPGPYQPTCSPICQRRENLRNSDEKLAPRAEMTSNGEDCPHSEII